MEGEKRTDGEEEKVSPQNIEVDEKESSRIEEEEKNKEEVTVEDGK